MKKRIISFAISAAMICSAISAMAESFSDLKGSQYSWCAPQIAEMADKGYVNGYGDGTFRPDKEVSKLEGIALFARMMGASDEKNAEILKFAHEQYDSALKTCSLAWGQDELAYLMYKGVFTASDLNTYIVGDLKDQPLSRGEAAVIITKAMGGEGVATSNMGVQLEYDDSLSIPSNILQYVWYVTDNGIMIGTDNEFRASEPVTRAQLAVMLSRVDAKCSYSFVSGKLVGIDDEAMTISVIVDNDTVTYPYTEETMFTVQGDYVSMSSIPEKVEAVIQLSDGKAVSVDAMSSEPEQTITAVFSSYTSSNGIIRIVVKESATATATQTYTCIENVPITYKMSPASIRSLSAGDPVTLELANGLVQSIVSNEKVETISGATVEEIEIDGEDVIMTISSTNANYDGKSYKIAGDVEVKKANKDSDLNNVFVGDKVTLTLRYGVITEISATSTYGTASGTIVSILIAEQPEITIKVDGKEKTYQVPKDCAITVNQKEGSLYDFRVGDNVTVTTQSNAVTKIQTSTATINTEGGVIGTVTAVNNSYGFISVQLADSETQFNVFKTANATTVITSKGKTIDFKSIKAGDTVNCTGTTKDGAFVATLIVVTQQ